MHDTIPVAEIMVTDVVTAPPDANVSQAATLLRDEHVSSVVVARDDDPVGIVTEGDFATQLCERTDLGTHELADVMSEPLETIAPETTIVEAVDTLRTDDLEHLPVVDDGELVGILTTTELSYYVPHLAHRAKKVEPKAESQRRQVRTDTQYERDEWEFEYRGEDETTVSVGDVARFSKTLSSEDVEAFAEISGDTNRLHLDASYAAETRFGERIVHGVLANGLISAALARLPGLTIYLSQESSFRAPLSIGEHVTATCEIVENLGGDRYRIETTVTDDDETVVLEGDAVVLIDELPPEPSVEEESATVD
ncbi:CBS domain-containing protein [Natronobacterium texcoconense]|uniref:CBS domain-containing protein n=1 Tax=Natronobacterium texcoconense TaxID=1095778 RepID=A0A1H1HW53_NATTX|nr:CBS domain-containing protein [Natronobacterium texcoconense]SDR29653.1 CBS domain-containing protein [Natronobacterium texcoconense]